MALLLASFGSNVLNEKEDDENKIGEAINRIQRFFHFMIQLIFRRKNQTYIKNNINTTEVDTSCLLNHFYLLFLSSQLLVYKN